MKKRKKKLSAIVDPNQNRDPHFETLDQLLIQLKKHLTSADGKKGTYGDYLRLLEFYRTTRAGQAREIHVYWTDVAPESPELQCDPAA
jgi:hypothetical protein